MKIGPGKYWGLFKVKRFCHGLLLFVHFAGVSQAAQDGQANFPSERIYVHVNSSLVFAGEYLLYSLYCLDNRDLGPSEISKIAYVELIGQDNNSVFKQKLRLTKGRSHADFFVPTSVPSGNYKLVAYTQWMRNFGEEYFFKQDITIINPYNGDQKVFLKTEVDTLSVVQNTQEPLYAQGNGLSGNRSLAVKIDLKKDTYVPREKVSFTLRTVTDLEKECHISIAVRKVDALPHANRILASSVSGGKATKMERFAQKGGHFPHLPEIRGELFFGKVMDTKTNRPVAGAVVSFSMPKHGALFKTALTDEKGVFYFSVQEEYGLDKAILQVIGADREDHRIVILESQELIFGDMEFYSFGLSRKMEKQLLERSFHNQIENAFFSTKPDTIRSARLERPFFLKNNVSYDLDDYTRFATLKETVVEVIDHLWITRDAFGNQVFKVRVNPPYAESDRKPLVLVDGIQVQQHGDLLDFNARQIKKIQLGRDRYVFGREVYEGAISIETTNDPYTPIADETWLKHVQLLRPQSKKNYFKQSYGTDGPNMKRIPDFRYQLLWSPEGTFQKAKEFSFYTSDISGKFEITVEGFTSDGTAISSKEVIWVK